MKVFYDLVHGEPFVDCNHPMDGREWDGTRFEMPTFWSLDDMLYLPELHPSK